MIDRDKAQASVGLSILPLQEGDRATGKHRPCTLSFP